MNSARQKAEQAVALAMKTPDPLIVIAEETAVAIKSQQFDYAAHLVDALELALVMAQYEQEITATKF